MFPTLSSASAFGYVEYSILLGSHDYYPIAHEDFKIVASEYICCFRMKQRWEGCWVRETERLTHTPFLFFKEKMLLL